MPDIQEHLSLISSELAAVLGQVNEAEAERLVDLLDAAPAVFLAGAGRSGLVARAAAMRLMHVGKTVHVAGDATTPAIRQGELLLILSGSGSTAGMAVLARKAAAVGARVGLITARPESELAGRADAVLLLPAGKSGQPLASLFEQAAFLFCDGAVMGLMRRRGVKQKEMAARHANLE